MRCLQARYFADLAFEPHIPCYKLDDFEHAYKLSDEMPVDSSLRESLKVVL